MTVSEPIKRGALADADEVAAIYACSKRHVFRMSESSRIPRPVKLGNLVRWILRTGDPTTGILDHIESGCPHIESSD